MVDQYIAGLDRPNQQIAGIDFRLDVRQRFEPRFRKRIRIAGPVPKGGRREHLAPSMGAANIGNGSGFGAHNVEGNPDRRNLLPPKRPVGTIVMPWCFLVGTGLLHEQLVVEKTQAVRPKQMCSQFGQR